MGQLNLRNCHNYQREACAELRENGAILNAACKEDPGNLSQYGVINFDICELDEQTGKRLTDLPRFILGSVLKAADTFSEGQFAAVILGEYLEHCTMPAAIKSLEQMRYVLADDGVLVLTFPLDGRPKEKQHAKHLLKVWVEGETGHDITVWHQTVWTDEMLADLFKQTGFEVISREPLGYSFVNGYPQGWGVRLRKADAEA